MSDDTALSPLDAPGIELAVEAALKALAAATDLDALKTARLEHVGERSPIALANRAIGGLAPADKAVAGKLLGQAKGRLATALAQRQAELEAERDLRVLVEESVDVTLPTDRRPRGARHPLETLSERIADIFVSMGWEIAEGPELEAEWFNFDALNFGVDHPARQMQDTFFVDHPASCCAPTRRPCRRARCSSASCPSTSRARARCSAPTSSTPRTRPCSTRSRAWPSTRA